VCAQPSIGLYVSGDYRPRQQPCDVSAPVPAYFDSLVSIRNVYAGATFVGATPVGCHRDITHPQSFVVGCHSELCAVVTNAWVYAVNQVVLSRAVLIANGHAGLEVSHNNEPNRDSEDVLDVLASNAFVAAMLGACAP
jgi:hypothetical protein